MQNWKYKVLTRILDMSNNTWSWWDNKSDMRTIDERLNEWTTGGWRLVKVNTIETAGNTVEIQFFLEIET
jgi:hypothetical protein